MPPKPRIYALEMERPAANDRKSVRESFAFAPGSEPVAVRVAQQLEIFLAMHKADRFDAAVLGRLRWSNCGKNGVDAALVLGRTVQLPIEEFSVRRMGPLPIVPETTHRRSSAAAADAKRHSKAREKEHGYSSCPRCCASGGDWQLLFERKS